MIDTTKQSELTQHTDCYFSKSKQAAEVAGINPVVVYQVFQKRDSIFCGIELVKSLFDKAIEVHSLNEGDTQEPWEPSIIFKANLQDMVEVESIYLGILARCTLVATNVRRVVSAAKGKPVLFFPARFDVPEVQFYDGYAAYVGGAAGCATPEQARGYSHAAWKLHGLTTPFPAIGTMPHALIAAFNGDTTAAALAFAAARPNERVHVLVDFHNDCVKTSVEVAKAFADKGMADRLAGVRLDTSEKLADKSLHHLVAREGLDPYKGVCPELVRAVRQGLNEAGRPDVKITVSGGFNAEKVSLFEATGVPVDVYAVGESFIRGANPYTSDIVARMEGNNLIPCGKVGRELKTSNRLTMWKGETIPA